MSALVKPAINVSLAIRLVITVITVTQTVIVVVIIHTVVVLHVRQVVLPVTERVTALVTVA
jgi:hypothetical protein